MRVLASTSETQGDQPGDYHWTSDGELVRLPLIDCADPACGCGRGFAGLSSHRATTTAAVQERTDLDVASYFELVREDIVNELGPGPRLDAELESVIEEELDFLETVLLIMPAGAIVGRSGRLVTVRRPPPCLDTVTWP